MNGQLANILKGDEQIGGLLDWDIRVVSNKGSDGENQNAKVINWVVRTRHA